VVDKVVFQLPFSRRKSSIWALPFTYTNEFSNEVFIMSQFNRQSHSDDIFGSSQALNPAPAFTTSTPNTALQSPLTFTDASSLNRSHYK
jgi:hypothetical protein